MTDKELGKIKEVTFGRCGYQNQQIGLRIVFSGDGWGVGGGTKRMPWDPSSIEPTENSEWIEEERTDMMADIVREVSQILDDADVGHISELEGVPVECEFEGQQLKGWRVLTEVL